MEILAIIQARGGSKGVPGKNIKMLCGKPLIAWTIEAAKQATLVNRVIVSTDDADIARVAKEWGAEVPFTRPAELASDSAKSIGLLEHALHWLQENEAYTPDAIVQLKPTNPLRTAAHIDASVEKYSAGHGVLDAVITVVKAPIHPLKTWRVDEAGLLVPFIPEEVFGIKEASKSPRQSLPEAYGNNSCVHVINTKTILEKHSSIGTKVGYVELSKEDSINIDEPFDFMIAELVMAERLKSL
jgi:CMP-N-acetylneuraminic acid synthetase